MWVTVYNPHRDERVAMFLHAEDAAQFVAANNDDNTPWKFVYGGRGVFLTPEQCAESFDVAAELIYSGSGKR